MVHRKPGAMRNGAHFAGFDQGRHRAASIYSLVVTARLNGVDPEA